MDELRSECRKLREAVDLLRKMRGDLSAYDAVGIIEDVIGELAGHDCDDFASECDECMAREWEDPDMPDVGECLELGLPLLEAKYGMHSMESETVRSVLADLGR